MTVYEVLKKRIEDDRAVAVFLCGLTECKNCIARDLCHMGKNGFLEFLNMEEDEAEDMWR